MENNLKIKVREDLDIELSEWTAKTKKNFMDLFRKKGLKIGKKDVYKTLIIPYIEPSDIFLTSAEYDYILIELKKFNFDDELDFDINCTNCREPFRVKTTLTDITLYEPSSLSTVKDNLVKFRSIPTQEVYNTTIDKFKDENEAYLQLLLSITELNGKESENIAQVLEDVESLSISNYNKVEELYIDNSSQIELLLDIECPHCDSRETYEFDSIPNFFESMLPKNPKDK